MFSPDGFYDLVSGRRRGWTAAVLRGVLRGGEFPYAIAMRARNVAYTRGWRRSYPVPVPIVSVGNLTMGGTGKTPMVRWLAEWFLGRDVRVGLVSRGYGAPDDSPNDEALELAHYLPDTPHVQNRDRVQAARQIVQKSNCRLLLLDDGFQHRRLRRDLDIVLLDALQPFGFGHVFPRGTLREPVTGMARSDVVVLSRSDLVGQEQRDSLHRQVAELAPHATWVESIQRPHCLISTDGSQGPIDSLAGRPVAAFCGLGNPDGFRRTLQQCGLDAVRFRAFPDHHAYTSADCRQLAKWAGTHPAVTALVCTHKDLVKVAQFPWDGLPLWALSIQATITRGQDDLEQRLEPLCG